MSILSDSWRSKFARKSVSRSPAVSVQPNAMTAATTLKFEELIAQKPHRWPLSLPMGYRGPDGERAGRGRAQSLSFDGVSPYQPGDDPRWVDWRATARSGKLQVKRFVAQSHRARMIVLRLDTDLFFGTQHQLMAKSAALVAALLVFDAQLINEPVGLICGPEEAIPARRGRRHSWLLLERIHQRFCHCAELVLQPRDSETDSSDSLVSALESAQSMLARGDEICLVDELAARDSSFDRWSKSAAARHALLCYLVSDQLTHQTLKAGRYPAQQKKQGRPAPWYISARGIDRANAEINAFLRRETNHLGALGWQVERADELLSRADTGPPQ